MTINISIQDVGQNLHPKITVLGVGGSGGNAVNNMINANLEGVDFLVANTDAQALQISSCPNKIQLGLNSTKGLGAGMRPDIGRQAAEEAIQDLSEKIESLKELYEKKQPSIPTTIKAEKKLNFFLKSNEENFKNHLNMNKANDLEVFTYLRHLKDTF